MAGALYKHSLQVAREPGFLAMQFNSVLVSNSAAMRLWQKYGFAIVGSLPEVHQHGSLESMDCHSVHLWSE